MVKEFSLVIPAYEEQENLPILMEEIYQMLQKSGCEAEIIFVDDGSRDATLQTMLNLKDRYKDRNIRVISLGGNFGLSAALDAGFRTATQSTIVSIDSDLQNDPADIPRLLERLPEFDVAIGVRVLRKDNWLKRTCSRIANNLRDLVLHEHWRDTGCSLKAYKKRFLLKIPLYKGMHRFLPTLLQLEDARVIEVEVNHRPRIHGKSKYHLWNRILGPLGDLFAVRRMKKKHES